MKYFTVKQLACPTPATFEQPAAWQPEFSLADWVHPYVLELSYTSWRLKPYAEELGDDGPPSTAHLGEANAAHTPSPVCLNNQPPCASITLHNTSSCAASAARIPSALASHRRVEPSTSVNKKVTTPEGAPAGGADTPAESHTRRAPTCRIVGIRPRPPPRGAYSSGATPRPSTPSCNWLWLFAMQLASGAGRCHRSTWRMRCWTNAAS